MGKGVHLASAAVAAGRADGSVATLAVEQGGGGEELVGRGETHEGVRRVSQRCAKREDDNEQETDSKHPDQHPSRHPILHIPLLAHHKHHQVSHHQRVGNDLWDRWGFGEAVRGFVFLLFHCYKSNIIKPTALLEVVPRLLVDRNADGVCNCGAEEARLDACPKCTPASVAVELGGAVPEASVEEELVLGMGAR